MPEHLIYGFHAVTALLERAPQQITALYFSQGRHDDRMQSLLDLAKRQHVKCKEITRHQLDSLQPESNHQGVIASCLVLPAYNEYDLEDLLSKINSHRLLILDGVQDPHNLGACLRVADAAGVHAVIIPKDNNASLTPTARKVACGAAEVIPLVQVTNLARALKQIKELGVWLWGTSDDAPQTIFTADLKGSIGLVMGAEGKGMRRLTREHCDGLIAIPMLGSVSSLNVSVAAGVCLYEIVRQQTS